MRNRIFPLLTPTHPLFPLFFSCPPPAVNQKTNRAIFPSPRFRLCWRRPTMTLKTIPSRLPHFDGKREGGGAHNGGEREGPGREMGNKGGGGGETLSSVLGAEYSQKWKRGPATVKKSCYNRQTCIRPKIEFAQISSKDALNQTFLAGDSRLENFLSGGEKREHHLFLLPLISVSYSLPSSPPSDLPSGGCIPSPPSYFSREQKGVRRSTALWRRRRRNERV